MILRSLLNVATQYTDVHNIVHTDVHNMVHTEYSMYTQTFTHTLSCHNSNKHLHSHLHTHTHTLSLSLAHTRTRTHTYTRRPSYHAVFRRHPATTFPPRDVQTTLYAPAAAHTDALCPLPAPPPTPPPPPPVAHSDTDRETRRERRSASLMHVMHKGWVSVSYVFVGSASVCVCWRGKCMCLLERQWMIHSFAIHVTFGSLAAILVNIYIYMYVVWIAEEAIHVTWIMLHLL